MTTLRRTIDDHQLAGGGFMKLSDPVASMRDIVKRKLLSFKVKNNISTNFMHPRIVRSDFYAGETWHIYRQDDLAAAYKALMRLPEQPTIHYTEVFEGPNNETFRHVAFIGHPGCGATTTALKYAEEKVMHGKDELVLMYDFRDLVSGNKKITLKDLLLTGSFPDMKPEHIEQVFSWMQTHQEQCTIIIDRLNTNITGSAALDITYTDKAKPSVIIVNLLTGKLFKKVKILSVSRPNEIIFSKSGCRAEQIYLLYGFSKEASKRVWQFTAGTSARDLWKEIRQKSPVVLTILPGSPFVQQLAVSAIDAGCNTTTQMYHQMTRGYVASVHRNFQKTTSWETLQQLAFNHETVALKDLPLPLDEVSDFMVATPQPGTKPDQLCVDDITVSFIHLLVREYFAVQHVLLQFSCKEFESYIGLDIIQRPTVELFLSGMLLDKKLSEGDDFVLNFEMNGAKI